MGLNLITSGIFLAVTLIAAGTEIYGVRSKVKGDTITENWRFADRWLHAHAPWADWLWRVATIGFLTWTMLHFAVGIH